jgi:hypothetical protein
MALALTGRDREQVLANLLELLATRAMEEPVGLNRDSAGLNRDSMGSNPQ